MEPPSRTDERLGTDEELRLGVPTLRLDEELRLELLTELRLEEELLRLGLLYELRLDEELLLRLEPLNELPDERLLPIELLWLPPPRLPPPPPGRWARAGVALSARAIIARVMIFEVFIMLLLSLFIVCFSFLQVRSLVSLRSRSFSGAKILLKPR